MAMGLIRGAPGEVWVNNTPKILWQGFCNFRRSCARCIALHHVIAPYLPYPIHDRCDCTQRPVKPGQSAAPFIDYQDAVAELSPAGQAAAMGASNWKLVRSGLARWEDVVTPGRIRDFREVVDRLDLTVERMVKAGVGRVQALRAYDATHTAAHAESSASRAALIQGLRNHGVSDGRIISEVADLLGKRFGVDGPGGKGPPPAPPVPPPPAPKPTPKPAPVPAPKAPEGPKPGPKPKRGPRRGGATAGPSPGETILERGARMADAENINWNPAGHAAIVAAHGVDMARRIPAMASGGTNTIHVNERHAYWGLPESWMADFHRQGWLGSDDPDHVIHHEVGHILHSRADWAEYLKWNLYGQFPPAYLLKVSGKVSLYAETQPVEFVAEVYAGIRAGKVYDGDVMEVYRAFGGPTP